MADWSRIGLPALCLGILLLAGCWREDPKAVKRPTGPVTRPPPTGILTPAPGPVTTGPTASASGWYIPRAAWSAQIIDLTRVDPMVKPIYRLTVHHSGDSQDAAMENEAALRLFEKAHKGKGWACIGYHFLVGPNGKVYEGRPIAFQGAHAGGDHNIGNIGVCLIGNFDKRPMPAAQRKSLESVIERLRRTYRIDLDEVHGHRYYKQTDCPGEYVLRWLDDYTGHRP